MKFFTIEEYKAADCKVFHYSDEEHNLSMYRNLNGKMCDSGCAFYGNGLCKSFIAMNAARPTAVVVETVKQEAARLGISISEVRKRRNPN